MQLQLDFAINSNLNLWFRAKKWLHRESGARLCGNTFRMYFYLKAFGDYRSHIQVFKIPVCLQKWTLIPIFFTCQMQKNISINLLGFHSLCVLFYFFWSALCFFPLVLFTFIVYPLVLVLFFRFPILAPRPENIPPILPRLFVFPLLFLLCCGFVFSFADFVPGLRRSQMWWSVLFK